MENQRHKYEINGLSFETVRPLTDEEMRFLMIDPRRIASLDDDVWPRGDTNTEYRSTVVEIPALRQATWFDATTGKRYVRNAENTGWIEITS